MALCGVNRGRFGQTFSGKALLSEHRLQIYRDRLATG